MVIILLDLRSFCIAFLLVFLLLNSYCSRLRKVLLGVVEVNLVYISLVRALLLILAK